MIITGTGGFRNKKTSGDHLNYCIVEIGQNTKKSWKLEETCCHSDSNGKQSTHAHVKNSQKSKIRIMIIMIIVIISECNKGAQKEY